MPITNDNIDTPRKSRPNISPVAFPIPTPLQASLTRSQRRRVWSTPEASSGSPLPSLGNAYEITQYPTQEPFYNRQIERYRLLPVVRDLLPKERVSKCQRLVVGESRSVEVRRTKADGKTFYKNLLCCNSVWTCPVCSAKISTRRQVELREAIDKAKSMNLVPYLLTVTVPHYSNQSLKTICSIFDRAYRKMQNRPTYKRYAERIGLRGTVKALEVTVNMEKEGNGWHYHRHVLMFCNANAESPNASIILELWRSACNTAGFSILPNEHGVSIENGERASNYVSKWGAEHEMTKSMIKKSNHGQSPWDLLRDFSETGDEDKARLFKEYAKEFKGKKQLIWSKGLRELLGMNEEMTDEEIAEQEAERESDFVCNISMREWRFILRHNLRGEVLREANIGGAIGVRDYLERKGYDYSYLNVGLEV